MSAVELPTEYQISYPPTEPNLANRSKNRVKKRYKNGESFSHLNYLHILRIGDVFFFIIKNGNYSS